MLSSPPGWYHGRRATERDQSQLIFLSCSSALVRLEGVAKDFKNIRRKQKLGYISCSQKSPSEVGGRFSYDFNNKAVYKV